MANERFVAPGQSTKTLVPVRALRLLGIGLMGATAYAAVPGVPAPPRPGPVPMAWANWANDAFGGEVGVNPDDFRTNAFGMGFNVEQWIFYADLSLLTDKQDGIGTTPSRSDELTISIGRMLVNEQDADQQVVAMAGLGLRHADDLGGGSLQNEWHRRIEFPEVTAPYDETATAGTAWFSSQLLWMGEPDDGEHDRVFAAGSRFGLSFDLSALASTEGELQADFGTNLLWAGHDGVVWLGYRYQMRGSEALTDAAAVVSARERGSWISYGFSVGAWYFEAALHPEESLSTGRLGWMIDRPPIHSSIGEDVLTFELGGTIGEYGLGVQSLWQPRWLRDAGGVGDRSRLFWDYRFGRVPESDLDLSVRYQHGMAGLDVSLFPPRDGLQINPFLYGGLGWRVEEVIHEGPFPIYAEERKSGPAFQGGAGCRLTWGRQPKRGRGVQYGLTLAYDRWYAFGSQDISALDGSGQQFTLLDERDTVTARVMISVGW